MNKKNGKDYSVELDSFIKNLKYYIPVACIIIVAVYFVPRLYYSVPPSLDSSVWGAVGDFFGGFLNPILSILTILLLVRSLRLQNQELSSATSEVRLTRKVHSQSLLYEDTKEIFQKRLQDIKKHQDFKICQVRTGQARSSVANLSFNSDIEPIVEILSSPYEDIKDKLVIDEKELVGVKSRVDYEFFVMDKTIHEFAQAGLDLLKMGVPPYIIRDDLEEAHGKIHKMKEIADGINTQRMENSWNLYNELVKKPNVEILV